MSVEGRDELFRAYWRELTYLRRMGGAFAEKFPKVAGRLELSGDESPDPHVERLIESFAFLTARVQRNIDGQLPEIASELLGILHPHFLSPVPSMAVARFEVDPERGKLTSGHLVPQQTPLFVQAHTGAICRFRTCYPVTLWPLEVTEARLEPTTRFPFLDSEVEVATVLRLRIAAQAGSQAALGELELDRLRLYLHGDRLLVDTLYELIFGHARGVALLPEGEGPPVRLPASSILPVGLGADEGVLPYPRQSHPGYRLLQEYFTFPEKFLFVDFAQLGGYRSQRFFDLLVLLDRSPSRRLLLDRETFLLGCTPIVNLFPRTTEPIRLDHRRTEYPLVPDARRETTTEIHSILSVSGSSDPQSKTRVFRPFYSFDHQMAERGHGTFWHARREPSLRPEVPGSEILLSLLDLDFNPNVPAGETIYAHTLCTNRALALELPAGTLLQTDIAAPLARIVCLAKPTPQRQPPDDGPTLWRLVSHLSLNHLSFSSDGDSLTALRELLGLYALSDEPSVQQQIQGLREMSHRPIVHRMGSEAWRGFCRGTEVTLTFDENLYVGTSAFLFGSVLNRFFALYASINSFTRLVIKSRQREGVWNRWPPMAGEQIVL